MRVLDGLLALPRLPVSIIILVVLAMHAQTIWAVVFALSVASWMLTARLVRGRVLVLREAEYVRAARAVGRAGAASCCGTSSRTRSGSSSSPSCSSCPA